MRWGSDRFRKLWRGRQQSRARPSCRPPWHYRRPSPIVPHVPDIIDRNIDPALPSAVMTRPDRLERPKSSHRRPQLVDSSKSNAKLESQSSQTALKSLTSSAPSSILRLFLDPPPAALSAAATSFMTRRSGLRKSRITWQALSTAFSPLSSSHGPLDGRSASSAALLEGPSHCLLRNLPDGSRLRTICTTSVAILLLLVWFPTSNSAFRWKHRARKCWLPRC